MMDDELKALRGLLDVQGYDAAEEGIVRLCVTTADLARAEKALDTLEKYLAQAQDAKFSGIAPN